MKSLLLLAAAIGLSASQVLALAAGPSEQELHTAQCVAALEASTDELAAQVKSGRAEVQPELLVQLKAGAAFIGDSYLHGERDEARARSQLEAALETQKSLAAGELAARQSGCAEEGARLLAKADPLGRVIVSQVAARRMKKMLAS